MAERHIEQELDYALNQVRLMRTQLAAGGAECFPAPLPARSGRRGDRLHAVLDRLQSAMPEFLRASVRRYYLKHFYYRLYPENSPDAPLVEPAAVWRLGLAHSGYAPLLAFKESLCRNLSMELASVRTTCEPQLVSVILPVYNGEQYVAQAIDSVLRQTYAKFELVVVDDGSTDSTPRILEQYASDARVSVYRQSNQKLPAALNAGFRCARGKFFTWISADNAMKPEMLETLVDFLNVRGDVEMVYSDEELIDERALPAMGTDFNPGYQTPPGSNVLRRPQDPGELNFIPNNYIGACFLYRAWAGRLAGEYDGQCFGYEDYDYWMRMNALFRIAHLGNNRILHSYRLHPQSLTAREKELRIAERARYFLPVQAERRRFFAEGFDIEFEGAHPWFEELASLYRRSGHNARIVRTTPNGRYVHEVTRAFGKRILIGTRASAETFAVFENDRVIGPEFELRADNPAALAWPLLAAANSRLWNRGQRHAIAAG